MRALYAMAAVATFATGQINAQTAPARDYSEAYPLAVKDGSFLVTWVGIVPSVRIEGTLTATVGRLKGFESGDVVVSGPSRDGKHVWYATLRSPSDAELKSAVKDSRTSLEAERNASLTATPKAESLPPRFAPHDDHDLTTGPWPKALAFIQGMMRYKRAQHTQSIVVLNERDSITPVHRSLLASHWKQSGGMEGIENVRSDLYYNGAPVKEWVGDIQVKNSLGFYQPNRGHKRMFADGAAFLDVLSNRQSGEVFEIRKREKLNGKWLSEILYEDENTRPVGYTGKLSRSCNSCHSEAGSGEYGLGLVPGGDGVLSFPFKALEK